MNPTQMGENMGNSHFKMDCNDFIFEVVFCISYRIAGNFPKYKILKKVAAVKLLEINFWKLAS